LSQQCPVVALSTDGSLLAGTGSPEDIAEAVWDEAMASHVTGGSTAQTLRLIKGLAAKAAAG
jgi:hypothetical protein